MTKPYHRSIDIGRSCSAISNLGSTWGQCWRGLLEGRRPFTHGPQIVAEWPDTPPVAGILDFGHFDGQPPFSARFSELIRCVASDLRNEVGTLVSLKPALRVCVLIASSGGDPGPLSALVDAAFRKAGPSEPVTNDMLIAMLGGGWNQIVQEGLGHRLPVSCMFGACASALVAVSHASDKINAGLADVVIVIALDTLARLASVGFLGVGANSTRGAAPYDEARDGTTVGEGAAGMILARQGVLSAGQVIGQVAGTAVYCDAGHLVEPNPNGVAKVAQDALDQAGIDPQQVSGIYWHGTGTRQNDKTEAAVSSLVFGDLSPPCTSTKGALGHTMGASGAFNILAACMTLETGLMPPVAGTQTPEYDNLDLVLGTPRSIQSGPILITALGFGGINAATVIVPAVQEVS